MRLYRYILFLLPVLYMFSCAKAEVETKNELEQRTLDAWMQMHKPGVEKLDNGMYIEFLRPTEPGAATLYAGDWIKITTRGTTLQNNVFMTHYEDEAMRLGSFSRYTHYTPVFTYFYRNMSVTEGEYQALLRMKKNDSVRLYLPSKLAYGKYGYGGADYIYGFAGNSVVGAYTPAIIDVVLNDIIEDVSDYESAIVERVRTDWGITDVNDTIRSGIYLKDLDASPNTNPKVGTDSLVYFDYVVRFAEDGFLIDTSVDTIARKEWEVLSGKGLMYYKVGNADSEIIEAIKATFDSEKAEIRYNSSYKMVFTSDWGYGVQGSFPTATSAFIYPYTPLIMEFTTYEPAYKP